MPLEKVGKTSVDDAHDGNDANAGSLWGSRNETPPASASARPPSHVFPSGTRLRAVGPVAARCPEDATRANVGRRGYPSVTPEAWTSAMIPALMASGNRSQAATTRDKSGGSEAGEVLDGHGTTDGTSALRGLRNSRSDRRLRETRAGLKIQCAQGRAGSTPASGTAWLARSKSSASAKFDTNAQHSSKHSIAGQLLAFCATLGAYRFADRSGIGWKITRRHRLFAIVRQ